MNRTVFYPAIFHKAEEGGFWISFPDFPEAYSQGETTEEAYRMAFEALGLCISDIIKNNEKLPVATEPMNISVGNGDVSILIGFDMMSYQRNIN